MKNTSIAISLLLACISIALIGCKKEQSQIKANSVNIVQKAPVISVSEMKCDELESCSESNPKCENEFKERLKSAIDYVDSAYAEGNVHSTRFLLVPFYFNFLKCDSTRVPPIPKSISGSFEKNTLSSEVVDKRIRNLLPEKGCIEDSLQYEKFAYTILRMESLLQEEKTLSPDQERYLNYLNRNCTFNYKYNDNLLIEEEKIIKAALENNVITKAKAEKLYNNKFSQIEKDDLGILKVLHAGTSFAGVGEVEKKKNRTVSYIEYPSVQLDAETALQLAVASVFKANVYSIFVHPSVENVEVGFAISELEYNLYVGYYHGIYAVTIKSSRSNLEKYFNKNNLKTPNFIDDSRYMSISNDDLEFLKKNPPFSTLKKWCKTNGFTCSKYLLKRVR